MRKVNFTMLSLEGLKASERKKIQELLLRLKDGKAKVVNLTSHTPLSWTIETEEIG